MPTGLLETACNGVDDDCNEQIDEHYVSAPTNCGVGACAATGVTTCVAGSEGDTCIPGTPAPNDPTCDNLDDNCNGVADEDYVRQRTTCGVGACAGTGETRASTGQSATRARRAAPTTETCDGVDNDCDATRTRVTQTAATPARSQAVWCMCPRG